MATHTVQIFNASADEPGGTDVFAEPIGARALANTSAVSAQQQSNPIDVDVTGAEATAARGSATASVPSSTTRYINYRNPWGCHFGSASTLLAEDSTDDRYIFARLTNHILPQVSNMMGGVRAGRAGEYNSMLQDNPLLFIALHDNPWHGTRAFEERSSRVTSWRYKYLARNRREDVLAHLDVGTWTTEINGPKTPSSGFSKTSVMPNLTDTGFQDWFADYAAGILMGQNLASDPTPGTDDGPDISWSAGYYNDSTQIVSPNISAKMQRTMHTGVVEAISVNSLGVVQDFRPSDQSIGSEVIGEDVYFLDPSGTGFVGNVIQARALFQGNVLLTTEPDYGNPGGGVNQDVVPSVGWRYCITNSSSTTQNIDWDKDGTADGLVTGSTNWGTGHKEIYRKIGDRVEAQYGRRSGFGSNMCNRSFSEFKDDAGWPSPHVFSGAVDYPGYENMSGSMSFQDDGNGDYEWRPSWSLERTMRALGFAMTYVNTSPNDFMLTKARGPLIEVECAGSYSTLNVNDYYFLEWWWAVTKSFHPMIIYPGFEAVPNATPLAIEHFFLDLDTNLQDPPGFGIYDDSGGDIGVNGPKGAWSWSSGQVGDFTNGGRRIYARRYGDFIVFTNMTDVPAGYNTYNPTGFPSRSEDTVTASDWSALRSGGMIAGGESIIRPDFRSYVNTRITNFLQTENPATWGGYNYGPNEPTPFDGLGKGDFATCKWMMRDFEGRYEGQSVNESGSFVVGPFTAEVYQVV